MATLSSLNIRSVDSTSLGPLFRVIVAYFKLQDRQIGTSQSRVNPSTVVYPSVTFCLYEGHPFYMHGKEAGYGVPDIKARLKILRLPYKKLGRCVVDRTRKSQL